MLQRKEGVRTHLLPRRSHAQNDVVLALPLRRFRAGTSHTAAVDVIDGPSFTTSGARRRRASALALALLVTPASVAWQLLDHPVVD